MTLIKSISGIRGTIGGVPDQGLTPLDIVKFTSAYGTWLLRRNSTVERVKVVVGRDARISGEMVKNICIGTLQGLGIDVIDLDLSTTPTVEIAVPMEEAQGGIILTASHNPKQWNALKLLNEKGEFISDAEGKAILTLAENDDFNYADVDQLGAVIKNDSYLQKHIDAVINLPLVDVSAIKKANLSVVVDSVNSTGGIFIPELLKQLGVSKVISIYGDPTGNFPHNPEPLPEHLGEIARVIKDEKADLGIVVDPDVDRLAFVCEDGSMFGEEYTLVAVADYVLSKVRGNSVSNMSSTRALRDVTEKHGGKYEASAVGEVNVVVKMKEINAVIGGEGNGGIIYPEVHYGRDALVGVGLFLTHLAHFGGKVSTLKASYPQYTISKNKIELTPQIDVDKVLAAIAKKYAGNPINTVDGVKIELGKEWVHLRKSNTEPIIRIYAESISEETANKLGERFVGELKEIAGV
jgi:phosphomannomutase